MPTLFRHADRRFAFLWEARSQSSARWHGDGEGPVQYLADTPDGAWAEFCRHEELTDPEDLLGVHRALWAVHVPGLPDGRPELSRRTLLGGKESYRRCQGEARRLRRRGVAGLLSPSAALRAGAARGWRTRGGLRRGPDRDGVVVVLFGQQPDLVGWRVVDGAPGADLLPAVQHFPGVAAGDPPLAGDCYF